FVPPPSTDPSPLSLHDALPISAVVAVARRMTAYVDRPARPCVQIGARLVRRIVAPRKPALLQRRGGQLPFRLGGKAPSGPAAKRDRKSTRLNSSHGSISYAVFC